MPQHRPVRYRCELYAQVEFSPGLEPIGARVVELSDRGGFIEEVPGLFDVQPGDRATLWLPLPGGEAWSCGFAFARFGHCRLELRRPGLDHLSVLVRGFGLTFDPQAGPERQQLLDFLDLLDTR